jgi:hypothetical protein
MCNGWPWHRCCSLAQAAACSANVGHSQQSLLPVWRPQGFYHNLDFLGMSVGEALCLYHNVHSLQELATMDEEEQRTLSDVAAAVGRIFHWPKSALRDEMHRLFDAAKVHAVGSIAQCNISVLDTLTTSATTDLANKNCPTEGAAGADGNIGTWDILSAQGNIQEPMKLEVQETDTTVMKNTVRFTDAFDLGLITEDILNIVLRALCESRDLAAASTDCAAKALLALEGIPIPDAVKHQRASGTRKKGATDRPAQIPGNLVVQHDQHHKVTDAPTAAAVKAAKKVIRDVFKWRAFGEMCGMDSKAAFVKIVSRHNFNSVTYAQLGNGFHHTDEVVPSSCSLLKEPDGDGETEELLGSASSSTAFEAPPGLELR